MFTTRKIEKLVRCEFGGGGPGAPPPPPKPPMLSNAASAGAKTQYQQAQRKGFQSTLLTGGLGVPNAQGVQKTLLGS